MADKKISDFSEVGTSQASDQFLLEKSGGSYRRQTRANLQTLNTGMSLDTQSGVDLLLQAAGSTGITVASSDATITVAQDATLSKDLTVTQETTATGGILDASAERYVAGVPMMGKLVRNGFGNDCQFVVPRLADGSSAVELAVRGLAQAQGTLGAIVLNITLIAVDGSTYAQATGSFTPANLGEDHSASLQTALDTAEAAFNSGEGRAITAGDVIHIEATTGESSAQLAIYLEATYA